MFTSLTLICLYLANLFHDLFLFSVDVFESWFGCGKGTKVFVVRGRVFSLVTTVLLSGLFMLDGVVVMIGWPDVPGCLIWLVGVSILGTRWVLD